MANRAFCKNLLFPAACALVLSLAACGAPKGGQAAGTRPISFSSSGLAQAVVGQVWYPAAKGSRERPTFYSSMTWGHAAPNAKPAGGAHRPLVVLAHGWRGTRFDLSWIGEALARSGYVVAAINMPDSDAQTFQNAQAPKVWFRARLQTQLIDALAHDAFVAPLVDTARVAVIGHSAGGSTALMLAGAELDPERFARYFPESAPAVAGTWSDPRVKAVVALNPGTGPAFSAAGLAHVTAPVLVVSGTGDNVAPEAENAGFYARNVVSAGWVRFADVDHYTFMPVCSPWGTLRGFGACIESHPNVDRAYVHGKTLQLIEDYLAQHLPQQDAPSVATPSLTVPPRAPTARTPLAPRRTSGNGRQ